MSEELPRRTVEFFRLEDCNADHSDPLRQDWADWCRSISDGPVEFAGMRFAHSVNRGYGVVCIHKAASLAFMSRQGSQGEVRDANADATDAMQLLHSTVVVFVPGSDMIGLARGSVGGAKQATLAEYVESNFPRAQGRHVRAVPVTTDGQGSAVGTHGFRARRFQTGTIRVSAQQELDQAPPDGLIAALERIASSVGADIDVSLKVRVRSDRAESQKALGRVIQKDLNRFIALATSATAVNGGEGETNRDYHLTSHPLTTKIELDPERLSGQLFSRLVDEVVDATMGHAYQAGQS